jgi:Na+:H+ antiporter, NhaA family
MGVVQRRLSKTFKEFFASGKSSGILLIVCTVISLILANSPLGENYLKFWQMYLGGLSIEHWVNDLLMAIFFLLIGLELKRELYVGELSNLKNAMLPIFAAVGGVAVPALFHLSLNIGTPTQAGIGIPMATDIAFALGVLAILGDRVPASLKVFLTALAVIDDLVAIIVIAVFYTTGFSAMYLIGALGVFGLLLILARFRVFSLVPYMVGGAVMWYLMLKSGVHATIAGVLLAFTIPFSGKSVTQPFSGKPEDEDSPSHFLEHLLHKPVSFIILPIFALANTGVVINSESVQTLVNPNEIGIMSGLFLGKPIGITFLSFIAVSLGISRLPLDLNWKHILGAGFLGGIGFTMSIFITNLAFAGNMTEINGSKMSILLASLTAGVVGFVWLKLFGQPTPGDHDSDTMDFYIDDNEVVRVKKRKKNA